MWLGSDRAHTKWKFCRTGNKTCTVRTTKKYLYFQKYESWGQWQSHCGPHTKWNITEPQIPQVTVLSEYRGKSDHIPIKILKYQLKGEKSNKGYHFVVSTTGLGRPSEEKGYHDTSNLSFSQTIQLVSLFWVHFTLTLIYRSMWDKGCYCIIYPPLYS